MRYIHSTYTYTHIYIYTYIYIYICTYIYIYIYIYVHINAYVYVYIYIFKPSLCDRSMIHRKSVSLFPNEYFLFRAFRCQSQTSEEERNSTKTSIC